MLRGRSIRTTYLYDDPAEPGRCTASVSTPAWTESDRAALLGLEMYESSLCTGCGEPKALAWHSHAEGEYEAEGLVCHGCTARNENRQQVLHRITARPTAAKTAKYPPFDINETTTEPDPPPRGAA